MIKQCLALTDGRPCSGLATYIQRNNRSKQTVRSLAKYSPVVCSSLRQTQQGWMGNDVVLLGKANLPKLKCQDLLDPTPMIKG